MKRILCAIFIAFSFYFVSGQQTKLANSLLWRISGKGLTKPSYLYGTIHLTDKRVFFLGDSVYNAIERSEGFAAELDMNSMGAEMMNYFIKQEQEKRATEPVKVKDVVDAEIWRRYKGLLAEKFGKNAENITVEELEDMSSLLENEIFRKGEMQTFLDAYLFGIAKRNGKWVGGVEDITDQIEHVDNFKSIEEKIQSTLYDEKYYRDGIEWFIKIYADQKLDSIDKLMYREESGQKDYIMIKRNLKMARRMDSLSAIRSTFFAVGTGHLPGDSGVIVLLKKMGFEVTPVISSKTIDPSKYVVKSNEAPWFPVPVKDSAYFLSMPGIASKFELLESYGLHTNVYFDISFMKMYMTMSAEIGTERKKLGADSLFNSMKKQFIHGGKNLKERKITVDGIEGRELRFTNDEGSFQMQFFLPYLERVVVNAIMTFKEQSVDEESKKFFQSFSVNRNAKQSVPEEANWTTYTNLVQSFSLDFPAKPVEKKDVRSEEGKIIHTYQALDIKSQAYYGLTISSLKEGLYLTLQDSDYFSSVSQDIYSRFDGASVTDSSFFSLSGFPACKFLALVTSQGTKLELNILSVLRGNRNYYLYTVNQPTENGRSKAALFFRSFQLFSPAYAEWKTVVSADKSFSTVSPFPFRTNKEREQANLTGESIIVYDTLASHTMYIDKTVFPSWYWHSSDTAFLRQQAEKYAGDEDSLVGYTVKNVRNTKVAEFMVIKRGQVVLKKVKMILSGNELYEVYGMLAQKDLEDTYYRFFDEFKISKELPPADLTTVKFKELSEAIQRRDRQEISQIKNWWNSLEFTNEELTGLRPLMFKVYPDLDSAVYGSFNGELMRTIAKLDSNNSMVEFIKNNYRSALPGDDRLRPLLVSYLADIKTKEAYNLVKEIFADATYPAAIDFDYNLYFYDSLALAATLYPEILKLTESDRLWPSVCMWTFDLLDSNLIKRSVVLPFEKLFVSLAAKKIEKAEASEDGYKYYDLVRLLGALNTPASNEKLKQFNKFYDLNLRFEVLIAMLKNNLAGDSRTIYSLALETEYSYRLYEELRKLNKLALFPKEFLRQEKIAHSKLYWDYLDEDYSLVVKSVGNKTLTYKGKPQKFYLFKVCEGGGRTDAFLPPPDVSSYNLAVVGPFSMNTKDCYSNHEATGVYWDKEFDEKKLDVLLKEYLDSLKEE